MNLKDLKKELLQDPAFREEYYKVDVRLDTALMIEETRIILGITQKDLAKKMGTKQAAISRAESGNYLPSLSFLERMAKALGTKLVAPKFAFLEKVRSLEKERIISIHEAASLDPAVIEASKIMQNNSSFSFVAVADIKMQE